MNNVLKQSSAEFKNMVLGFSLVSERIHLVGFSFLLSINQLIDIYFFKIKSNYFKKNVIDSDIHLNKQNYENEKNFKDYFSNCIIINWK